jgi:phage terminase Nu1 subunit (DNA packaging protein)
MLTDVSGSRKSKMAAVKPEVHVSQLVDFVTSKFQRQYHVFADKQFNVTKENIVERENKCQIEDGAVKSKYV